VNPEIYQYMSQVEESHWWFLARRAIIAKLVAGLQLPGNAKILDAGCGTGGNLAMLSSFGEVEATELDDRAREIALAKGVALVVPGQLPDGLPFKEPRYDLVALLDVLEHVTDDEAALKSLAQLLKPAGHILITAPAFPSLWSGHDEVHHHHRRYRLKELEGKVRTAGMEVVYSSYFNTLLFPLVAASRLYGRLRKGRGGSDLVMPNPLVNRILYAVFSSERAMLGRFRLPFGVSALVVARKGK
jgi:SAM-dependent methyltransferase